MVGELIGEGAAREEAVVGETPNLAARLQALAAPGSVVISQATRRLLGGLFELEDLGPQRLKGFAEPLAAWRVAGEGRAEGRFEARQTAGLTPLVGRDEEIALLLRRWQQAKDGEGHVVLLSGEPGIGKSRLVREVRARLEDEPHVRLLYQCSPHHTTSPLHPLIEQLERAAGFARDDPPAARLRQAGGAAGARHRPARAGGAADRGAARPADGRPLPGARSDPAAPEAADAGGAGRAARRPRGGAAGAARLRGRALERPDHAGAARPDHRAPPAPAGAAADHLPAGVQPAVACAAARQRAGALPARPARGRRPGRAGGPGQAAAGRGRGADRGQDRRRAAVRRGADQDGARSRACSRTRATITSWPGRCRRSRCLRPCTTRCSPASTASRPVKEIAQIGAALGREFSHGLLAAVADRPEAELQAALDQLVAAELVYRRGTPPDVTYSFKHALVQDAAYGTLLKSRRQQLHARIAQVLEEQFPEIVETQPELLAQHYSGAGLTEQAIIYWDKAGERAIQRSANAEAIERLSKALELLAMVPETPERIRQELALQTRLGPAVQAVKGQAAPDVEAVYNRARELCARVTDCPPLLFSTLRGLWVFHMLRARHDEAHEFAGQMLALAQRERSDALHLEACKALGQTRFYLGEFVGARTQLEEALRLYNPEQHRTHALLYGPRPRGRRRGLCGLDIVVSWPSGSVLGEKSRSAGHGAADATPLHPGQRPGPLCHASPAPPGGPTDRRTERGTNDAFC